MTNRPLNPQQIAERIIEGKHARYESQLRLAEAYLTLKSAQHIKKNFGDVLTALSEE